MNINKSQVSLLLFFFFLISPFLVIGQGYAKPNDFLTIAVTTSTANSGLLNYLLPRFEENFGIEIRVIIRGTGQALETGKKGDVDLVLVHAEELEKKYVADGYFTRRNNLMYNDFVLLGPANNPAKIKNSDSIVTAFEKVISSKSIFVSRGDNSGTHVKENLIWDLVEFNSPKQYSWYLSTGSGMGATINTTVAKNAYTLSDRASWVTFKNKYNTKIILEGDKALKNQYGILLVNPQKHPHTKKENGKLFIDWLLSSTGQSLIASYKVSGQYDFRT